MASLQEGVPVSLTSAALRLVKIESNESNMRGPSMIPRGLADGSSHPAFVRGLLIHSPCRHGPPGAGCRAF